MKIRRFKLRHRTRVPILGRFLGVNLSNGRPTSVTMRIGPLTWNSRRRGRMRVDLPGRAYGDLDMRRDR